MKKDRGIQNALPKQAVLADSEEPVITISGTIGAVRFRNEETGYTVAMLKQDDEVITVVAHLPSLRPHEIYNLTGTWKTHPRYGRQFVADSVDVSPPVTIDGIREYLSTICANIGPGIAKRITDHFALETFVVIEKTPERLMEVEGIGPTRAESLVTAYRESIIFKETMVFLFSHGIKGGVAARIFKEYGVNSLEVLRTNPFRLVEVHGLSFRSADLVANKLGYPRESNARICSGLLFALESATNKGHVFLPRSLLMLEAAKLLEIDRANISGGLALLEEQKRVIIESHGTDPSLDSVYLPYLYRAEIYCAQKLRSMADRKSSFWTTSRAEAAIRKIEESYHIELSEKQREAVYTAASTGLSIITGGPGTGKSTILSAIIELFDDNSESIALAAPTGKAARRMYDTTGHEAKTIHRLLNYSPREGGFLKNEDDQLDFSLLVVDEASMIPLDLLMHLLKAVSHNTTVVLVGDVDQLPCIGAGNVLKDMIASGVIPVTRLDQIFRQSARSNIIVNCHQILKGASFVAPREDMKNDFICLKEEDQEKILKMIVHLASKELPKMGFDPLNDIQVLTPMKAGILGRTNLNAVLQRILNPHGKPYTINGTEMRIGSRLLMGRNNYDITENGITNGSQGIFKRFIEERGEAVIEFDGEDVLFTPVDMLDLSLAFAITVHKSQGSEFTCVLMPLHTTHYALLQRQLLYTGASRGKKLVVIVGSPKAVNIALRNDKVQERFSKLDERLKEPYR